MNKALFTVLQLGIPPQAVVFKGPRVDWYQPTSLQQLIVLRNEFPQNAEKGKPHHRLLVGNTEVGTFYIMFFCDWLRTFNTQALRSN